MEIEIVTFFIHGSVKLTPPPPTVDNSTSRKESAILSVLALISREKGRDLTQSYDKSPYTNRNVKRAK